MNIEIPRPMDDEAIKEIQDYLVAKHQLIYPNIPDKFPFVRVKRRSKNNSSKRISVVFRETKRNLEAPGRAYRGWDYDLEKRFQTKLEAGYFVHRVTKFGNPDEYMARGIYRLGLDRMRATIDPGLAFPFICLQVFNASADLGLGVIVDKHRDDIPDYDKELSKSAWFWRKPEPGNMDLSPRQMLIEWNQETGAPDTIRWRSLLELVTGEPGQALREPLTLDYRLDAIRMNRVDNLERRNLRIHTDRPIYQAPGEPVRHGPEDPDASRSNRRVNRNPLPEYKGSPITPRWYDPLDFTPSSEPEEPFTPPHEPVIPPEGQSTSPHPEEQGTSPEGSDRPQERRPTLRERIEAEGIVLPSSREEADRNRQERLAREQEEGETHGPEIGEPP